MLSARGTRLLYPFRVVELHEQSNYLIGSDRFYEQFVNSKSNDELAVN
jgi:hypothetical protein